MDWRRLRDPNPDAGDCELTPTFLYALPFSETDIFVEETVLTSRPTTPIEACRSRLETRLRQLDIHPLEVHEEENCFIPMGGPIPRIEESRFACLPFGAAAGFVHPATGYSLLQSIRLAPAVADAIVDGWSKPAAAPPREVWAPRSSASTSDSYHWRAISMSSTGTAEGPSIQNQPSRYLRAMWPRS